MADEVLIDIADRIATITLNRHEARNALNRAVRQQLPAAILACEANDDVDVMILTGTDPAFSAGVDLKDLARAKQDLLLLFLECTAHLRNNPFGDFQSIDVRLVDQFD